MNIAAIALRAHQAWPEFGTDALAPGLNVFHGPSASGKTTVADLVAHALYGRRLLENSDTEHVGAPQGEVVIDRRGKQYRLRRSRDETAGERLTVAALDHSAVDQDTVRQLVACLSPSLLRPLFAVNFRQSPRLEWLLSPQFSHEFRSALWRLKWAPPTVGGELRPLYARLRALETQVATLVRGLRNEASRRSSDRKIRSRTRHRRASAFLAQLTDGELGRLRLSGSLGQAQVITRVGQALDLRSLWSTQRDQVYLSLCLALVSALGRHGARLPLVLDEPFARLDAHASAMLTEVLHEFSTRGHQVLVFTAQAEATQRFAALGARTHAMEALRGQPRVAAPLPAEEVPAQRIHRRAKTTRMKHREAG